MRDGERDIVDDVVEAWQREGEGVDPASIGIISRIWYLAKLLGEDRRRTLDAAGVDPAILDLLSVLRRAGPPYRLTTRELAARSLITAGAVSQRLARAEAAGLIERKPADDGSRHVVVELTSTGRKTGLDLLQVVLDRERVLLAGLSSEKHAQLESLLRTLLRDVVAQVGDLPRTQVGS